MLHTRKLAEFSQVLQETLRPVMEDHQLEGDPAVLAKDHERWGVRVDLSKSAAKLRRRLFAQWRSPLVLHELVSLSDKGWGLRPKPVGPDLLGDLVVDHLKLVRGIKMLHPPGASMCRGDAAVDVLSAFVAALAKVTITGMRAGRSDVLGTLLALHGLETARRIKKDGLAQAVVKMQKTLGLPESPPAEVAQFVKMLEDTGFIQDEAGKYWRLQGNLKWSF